MKHAVFVLASTGWMPILWFIGGGIVFIAILWWLLIKIGVLTFDEKDQDK